ncbi:MAG TPA: hypothetical protein GXX14_06230 [Clostridiaceae bacterium]|nr:hypothetical protein [Clostridiaceae bacterium]
MRVGYGESDITPPLGIELSGYGYFLGRKAEGVLDPLYARSVCFYDSNKTILIISCDLIGLRKDIVEQVKARLCKELNLSKEGIMVLCTHTHSGPATSNLIACGEPDETYIVSIIEKIVDAGVKAFKDIQDVYRILFIDSEFDGIGYNRVFGENGCADSRVRGLLIERVNDDPIALVNYACHPVVLGVNNMISADYPGQVVRVLNGLGYKAMFLTGFCGDIDPLVNLVKWGSGKESDVVKYGTEIANAFINGIDSAQLLDNYTVDTFEVNAKLSLFHLTEQSFYAEVKTFNQLYSDNPKIFKALNIWAEEKRRELGVSGAINSEDVQIQAFKIGKTLLIGVPGEVFTEIGSIIRNGLHEFNIMLLGYANEVLRYFPTAKEIKNKGYEGYLSAFLYRRIPLLAGESERMGHIIVKTLNALLNESSEV